MHDHSAGGDSDHDDGQHSHWHDHNGDADHHTHTHSDADNDRGDGSYMEDGTVVLNSAEIVLADSFQEATFYNREFSADERKALAKKGHALKDGSYPIENCKDAENAREAYGRAPEGKRSAVAAHIKKRESELKCSHGEFKPGSDNSTDLVITDEDARSFASMIRL
jgi:hypothetical protein